MIKETHAGYKEIIEKQGFYIASPIGTSMYPLIVEGIDTVKIVPKVPREIIDENPNDEEPP